MAEQPPRKPTLKPTALALANAARLLTAVAGKQITEAEICADLDAGAPANADGTINLVHYTAWLVKEAASHGD